MTLAAFSVLFAAVVAGYLLNRQAAAAIRTRGASLHSLVGFHAAYSALLVLLPGFVVILLWLMLQGGLIDAAVMGGIPADAVAADDDSAYRLVLAEIKSIARGQVFGTPEPWKIEAAERWTALYATSRTAMVVAVGLLSLGLLIFARARVSADFRARQSVEAIVLGLMIACSTLAIFTTLGIVLSLMFESVRFFQKVPVTEFLFGLRWEPQIAIRADQVAGAGAFGVIPVILGSVVIMVIALVVAVPIGLMSAIYLNEFATQRFRKLAKPVLEILAGVPTIVYGFFAILVVAPFLRGAGQASGLEVSPNTALAAGICMAIMLIPFISSFADDALSAVPRSLRDGSLALGATRAETMLKVMFPAAIPGIVGGVLLAVSRAIGETMIVVMAAGIIARLTINPLDSVTTVTVQIVTLLIGDTEFDNPKTLAAFALGMLLFVITLGINVLALRIVRKYRELYD
ncbi:MAG: phosphate ABC transporter permease subunit PstC [Gemmobacter sp.]|uniref:phosphate ABC transporter permease subunit PstC n=1 Tax=Gemmobacter sp. TaxID=1898957 RepID=UPI00391BCF58